MAGSEADVRRKVRDLERARDGGTSRKAGQRWTVASWLTHWVENIGSGSVRDNTLSGYRVAVNRHLIPGVGGHRLDRLEPEHLEKLYRRMVAAGSAPATAHQAHRTIRTALNEAVRRGHLVRNPATIARAPRLPEEEVEPYSMRETRRILDAAAERPNGARWALALALGLRQGEALGLTWSDVDLDGGTLTVRRGRQRPRWRHGCGSTPCGRRHGGFCPKRIAVRADTAETKSRAGRRTIGLPDQLVALLRQHRKNQAAEREHAAQLWREGGWLFTTPTGGPVNPRTDYTEWKRVLVAAGVREGRLHDARHTAATVLLVLGVPDRVVMDVMGWSNAAMAKRYQHITATVRKDVATRLDGLIWATTADDDDRGDDDGPLAG